MFPFTIEKLIFQLIGATMISMYWIYKWILVFNSFNACRVLLRIMNSDEMPNAAYLLFQPQYLEIIAKLIKITQCLHNFISCTLIIFFLRFAWNSEGQQSPGVIIDHHYVVSYSQKKYIDVIAFARVNCVRWLQLNHLSIRKLIYAHAVIIYYLKCDGHS